MLRINPQIAETLALSRNDFKEFINQIFSQSFPRFIDGEFINELADWMNDNDWFMRVSAKDHFKSTSLYADFMQQLIKHPLTDIGIDRFLQDYKKIPQANNAK